MTIGDEEKTRQRLAMNTGVVAEFREHGRASGVFEQVELVVLTVTGARSGEPRTVPLVCFHDPECAAEDGIFVVASDGGSDRHPAWYRNLSVHPELTIETVHGRYLARAGEVSDGAERERLFGLAIAKHPEFASYRAATTRRIPLMTIRLLEALS